MKAKRILPTLPVLAAFAIAAVPTAAAQSEAQAAVSENWAGYAVGGNDTSFSDVSGSWVQPKATCGSGQTYSAFWVGLGGSSEQSDALEQAGTQSDCNASGQATYYAWYELVPAAPVKLAMTVNPGDHMSAKVSVSGDSVTVTVSDATTGQSVTKTLTTQSIDTSSAEWIAEAPSACDSTGACQPLSLANFGSVTFTNAFATAGGHAGTISDPDWTAEPVALSPAADQQGLGGGLIGAGYESGGAQSSTAGATPSTLSSDGSSFSVSYEANASSSSATSAGSGGYGNGGADGYGGAGSGGYGASGDGGYGDGGYGGYGYGGGYGSGGGDSYGYGDGDGGYGYAGGAGGYGYGAGGYGAGSYGDGGYGAGSYGDGGYTSAGGYGAYSAYPGYGLALVYGS